VNNIVYWPFVWEREWRAARDAHFPTHGPTQTSILKKDKRPTSNLEPDHLSDETNCTLYSISQVRNTNTHTWERAKKAKGGSLVETRGETTILPPALRGQLKFLWKLDCKFILLREQYNLQSYIIIIGQRAASWKIRRANYKFERNNSPGGDIYCNFTPITRVQVWYYFIFILVILFLRIARE